MRQEQDKSEKKRDRGLLGLAGGAFVVAACILGGLYSQRNAAQGQAANASYRGREVPRLSEEKKAQYTERAKFLRAKMEPWARKHQAEIKRMMSAGSNDIAALDAVWQLVPLNPEKIGVTPQELMPSGDPGTGVGFGWSAASKMYDQSQTSDRRTNPDEQAMTQRIKGMAQSQLQSDFKKHHDIALMVTTSGHTWTYVWASGRVTQATDISYEEYEAKARLSSTQQQPFLKSDIEGPAQEVAPAYDFLTSPASS